ncbi:MULTISPECIES: histidinol-phosphatase [unclassified Roseitalea]|uniref:histidinol-phosphatase n=1 Tax=unclassified Roseitalea TaxID=2639107 RepID=UPI00273D51C9|nr:MULTISPECIES: histidinol-phosphatase [unclassified Roseitalea]
MPSLPDRAFVRRLAAAAAAETLPRFRASGAVTNKTSAGFDPVTEADRAAERVLRALIAEAFPDHGIIGEEFAPVGADRSHVWVIDPIDGTRAFISGLPLWGTLVGLTVDGVARCGFMHQPFTDELFLADEAGAVLIHGGRPEVGLKTRRTQALAEASLFTTTPALYQGERRDRLDALEAAVRMPRYGCDCYAFAMLAAGHADIVIEPDLNPHDIVALVPVIERAGGVVTTWTGERPEKGGDVVAAATPELHEAARAVLAGG